MDVLTWLLLATWLNLGFQAVVTVVVYPALPEVRPDDWAVAHRNEMRRIIPLVVLVQAVLLWSCVRLLLAGDLGAAEWVVIGTVAAATVVSAAWATPLHRRLQRDGFDRARLRSLLLADRLRLVLAAAGAVAAAVASAA